MKQVLYALLLGVTLTLLSSCAELNTIPEDNWIQALMYLESRGWGENWTPKKQRPIVDKNAYYETPSRVQQRSRLPAFCNQFAPGMDYSTPLAREVCQ